VRALDAAIASQDGGLVALANQARPLNVLDAVWDEREAHRFAKLAFRYPQLLSRPEHQLWQRVLNDTQYWRHSALSNRKMQSVKEPPREEGDFLWERFEADWESLNSSLT